MEYALKAAEDLFAIENVRGVQGHARMPEFGDSVQVQLSMCTLPPLVLAVEAAATDPHGQCSMAECWKWCHDEAKRIARDLREWVQDHETDVAPATTAEENGSAGYLPLPEDE